MCFVHFVKEHDSLGALLKTGSELASLVMSNVARRRANQLCHLHTKEAVHLDLKAKGRKLMSKGELLTSCFS